MKILSLFDWISCGRLALERAGIQVDKYFASEVDKYAIQIAKKNYPDTIHIGSVTDVSYWYPPLNGGQPLWSNYPWKLLWWNTEEQVNIDMIIWWSPCQDLSIAKKDWKGLQWEKSSLFFEYVRLLKEVKPKYFLLENVASMKKADKEEITRILWVEPVMINSTLVSAQNRKRLYWFWELQSDGSYKRIDVEQPEDKGILLKDILEESVDEKYTMNNTRTQFILNRPKNYFCPIDPDKANTLRTNYWNASANEAYVSTIRVWQFNSGGQWDRVYSPEWKSVSLSANGGGRGAKTWLYKVWQPQPFPRNYNELWLPRTEVLEFRDDDKSNSIITNPMKNILQDVWCIRKLTPIECERLQTLPDNWTEWISNTQRYKAIWNGWTVDVIKHIFKQIK